MTTANEQERTQVAAFAEEVQEPTGDTVEVASVDHDYTGKVVAQQAAEHVIKLKVGGEPAGSEAGLRALDKALGGRAQLCLDALPRTGA